MQYPDRTHHLRCHAPNPLTSSNMFCQERTRQQHVNNTPTPRRRPQGRSDAHQEAPLLHPGAHLTLQLQVDVSFQRTQERHLQGTDTGHSRKSQSSGGSGVSGDQAGLHTFSRANLLLPMEARVTLWEPTSRKPLVRTALGPPGLATAAERRGGGHVSLSL